MTEPEDPGQVNTCPACDKQYRAAEGVTVLLGAVWDDDQPVRGFYIETCARCAQQSALWFAQYRPRITGRSHTRDSQKRAPPS